MTTALSAERLASIRRRTAAVDEDPSLLDHRQLRDLHALLDHVRHLVDCLEEYRSEVYRLRTAMDRQNVTARAMADLAGERDDAITAKHEAEEAWRDADRDRTDLTLRLDEANAAGARVLALCAAARRHARGRHVAHVDVLTIERALGQGARR